jgi:hypothetical protein
MAQAFPSTALTADGTEFLHSEMTSSYLSMSPSLLAAAEVPSGARGRYTMAQAQGGAGGAPTGRPSLEDLSKEMDNPLGKLWIIFMQNDTSLYDGRPLGEEIINTTTILPVLSFPLGESFNFAVRPIIPFIASPKPQVPGGLGQFPDEFNSTPPPGLSVPTDRVFEIADIKLMTLFGPSGLVADKFVLGLGPTFSFPTATDNFFGSEKLSIGPAVTAIYLGNKWKFGLIAQHWWSVAGEDNRPDVSVSNIQYLIYYELPKLWTIGMGPNVIVNWEADDGDKLTFPIGIGFQKTSLMFGKIPVRWGFEVQVAVVHPDNFGQRWNLRLIFAPVIPSPFMMKQMKQMKQS